MNTDLLKNQHTTIRQLVSEIELGIGAGDVTGQAFELSLKISQLSGTLVLHLKSEDEYIYPTLGRSTTENIRKIAEQLNREMGYLAADFMEYKRTYMLASKIKADPQKFVAESKTIIDALKNRLDKEDRNLYPLV
ncbi:hemerythrin domain-containing protein [Desulfitobacterium metallireducens]|uniref:Cation-binding protein n=1 Tax=Desulfitobacterium metallireducens DSM 15288 TaxID=871968 RepID=W0E625_9FIRM|nr:hemerythrin domain-containing protein [Desulfitobacterium metallireducens]AHF06172.1 cation-binding protein [Desulfitobacterium metallireducens DSM 15288]